MVNFEWDERKALINAAKHGVTFIEASTVFGDENTVQFFDEEHSDFEDRYLMLGMSFKCRLLLILHSADDERNIVRIISARRATRAESTHYSKQMP